MFLQSVTNILCCHCQFQLTKYGNSQLEQTIIINNVNHSFFVIFFTFTFTDVIWRVQLIMVGVRWSWHYLTIKLRPRERMLDELNEDWEN